MALTNVQAERVRQKLMDEVQEDLYETQEEHAIAMDQIARLAWLGHLGLARKLEERGITGVEAWLNE